MSYTKQTLKRRSQAIMERNRRSLLIQHPLSRLICETGHLLAHVLCSPSNSQLLTPTSLHTTVPNPPTTTPRSWGRLFTTRQSKVQPRTNRHSLMAHSILLLLTNNSSRSSSSRTIRRLSTHQMVALLLPVRALSSRLTPSSRRRNNNRHILHQLSLCTSHHPLTNLLRSPQLVLSLRLIHL